MADIVHHFQIKASPQQIFRAISTPQGLDAWWSKSSQGRPGKGEQYELGFGPGYDWRAEVSEFVPECQFELRLIDAHEDWLGTRVGFSLDQQQDLTQVRFHHSGWPQDNEHYRVSCYCWAMYLRLLKRFVELGDVVPYEDRLDA